MLTPEEQHALRDAQRICERLAMQLPPSDEFTPEGISATNLVVVVEKYCDKTEAAK